MNKRIYRDLFLNDDKDNFIASRMIRGAVEAGKLKLFDPDTAT